MSAWSQANLINVHVPRGKRKVQPRELAKSVLPKRENRVEEAQVDPEIIDAQAADPKAALERQKQRVREKRQSEERRAFWNSPEGRKLWKLLDDGERE